MQKPKIAITGGTGALGKQLITDLITDGYEKIRILSRDEHKQAALHERFGKNVQCFVADVRDYERMRDVLHGVGVVIHAAALKRVDGTPYNLVEHRKTNIMGTVNVLRASLEVGVKKVLTISSDKACMPFNAYGATKMWAELETTHFNSHCYPQGMMASCVRYGNVFDSTGSVVQTWKKAQKGGVKPSVSDERMTRFHMTLAEASLFCRNAVNNMVGGEIFIPKLPSMRLMDLLEAVFGVDVKYDVTGLRPGGEKLCEQLLNDEEVVRTIDAGWAYLVKPILKTWTTHGYEGIPLPQTQTSGGFLYRSDVNKRWMSIEQLKELIDE